MGRRLRAVIAAALAAGTTAACAAAVAGTAEGFPVPASARLFGATRPAWADCSRVDTGGLGRLLAVDVPAGHADRKPLDPATPNLTWARCTGRAPSALTGVPGTGPMVWIISFATSQAATSEGGRLDIGDQGDGWRELRRSGRLGDARAEVWLDTHESDHETLLVITVIDPTTGRPAAQCGLGSVRGALADEAADWCLRAVAGQLTRPWLTASPSASLSDSPSPSGSPSGSPSESPSPSGSPSATGSPSVTGSPSASPAVTAPSAT